MVDSTLPYLPRPSTDRVSGICAGKSAVASHLVREHNFKLLHLERTASTPSVEKSASNATVPHGDEEEKEKSVSFRTAELLLDFVTAHWRERWVITDIWDENVLDVLTRRPFFLLVSVDAPVSVRWERFKARYVRYSSLGLIDAH